MAKLKSKEFEIKKLQNKQIELNKWLELILFIFGTLLYINTLNHGYVLDDFSIIKDNKVTTKGISSIPTVFSNFYRIGYNLENDGIYRPFTVSIFAIEWQIAPNKPALGHFINILLYALTGLIIFKTLKKLFFNYNILFPFFSTLIFICHPIHTEVVANIKSLDEILSLLFGFLCLNNLIDYINENKLKNLFIGIIYFFIGLLSKESSISFLLVIPLLLYFQFPKEISKIKKSFLFLFLSASIFLLIRYLILHKSQNSFNVDEVYNPLISISDPIQRISNEMFALGYYLKLLIIPSPLIYIYTLGQFPILETLNVLSIVSLVIYIILLFFGIKLILKRNIIGLGILFFLITIFVYSNLLFLIGAFIAERFLYNPSLGFCIAFVAFIFKIFGDDKTLKSDYFNVFNSNKKVIYILFSVAILFSILTITRNPDWKDNFTLIKADIKKQENSYFAHQALGEEYIKLSVKKTFTKEQSNQYVLKGLEELEMSLTLNPNNYNALNRAAIAATYLGDLEKAEILFKKALKIDSTNPEYLGQFYVDNGKHLEAVPLLEKVNKNAPNNPKTLMLLGISYGAVKKYPEAINYLNQSIKIAPLNEQAKFYLSAAIKLNNDSLIKLK